MTPHSPSTTFRRSAAPRRTPRPAATGRPAPVLPISRASGAARDRWALRTILELSQALQERVTLDRVLAVATAGFQDLLPTAEVGIRLGEGGFGSFSDEQARDIAEMEEALDEGPTIDALTTGFVVANVTATDSERRWPTAAALAEAAGFIAVHAIPLRHRTGPIGVVGLYCRDDRPLGHDELEAATAVADVVAVAVAQLRSLALCRQRATQLQEALDAKTAIEQAKGMLAERLHVPAHQASEFLRSLARARQAPLVEAAEGVISGELTVG